MEAFVTKVRSSSTGFACQARVLADQNKAAARAFLAETTGAGRDFGRFLASEAREWGVYFRERSELLGSEASHALTPRDVERRVLVGLDGGIDWLSSRIETRLEELQVAEASGDDRSGLPFGDYESLTAKEIVARVGDLSDAERQTVYLYEQGHKRRATVLRALQQRPAA